MRRLWKNTPLAREITLVLLLKLVFIFGLWFAFFRHPAGHTPADVSRAVLGGPPALAAPPPDKEQR